jgi:hypothetical protein
MCGAMEADPFEQPYWNLDQYLIWLASRDPAAVLKATDHPNSGTNPPSGWRMHRESNVDHQNIEMEAIRAIQSWPARQVRIGKSGPIKVDVRLNRKWVIDFEDKPPFAALLMGTTKHGRRKKVRPQFNPQIIRQLYRARTPSDICDESDVENPDVGRFIAYEDAWNLLAECISLRKTLPIDEAGSHAEKIIRNICMKTPEKLTMWGILKNDPGAELKPVTPQAWQVLSINDSINPLYDWATKGEYGRVIWTGLCFDRKQFVAAVRTGSGSRSPSHTPTAQPTQLGERTLRKQPLLRERALRALNELYPNGVPNQAIKTNAELIAAVKAHFASKREMCPGDDTILRAARRRK